jgi:ABC-type dipeptide/oligopeptide/nickel transport system permease subunit
MSSPDSLLEPPVEIVDEPAGQSVNLTGGAVRRFLKNKPAVVGLLLIVFIVLAAIFGPMFADDPNKTDIASAFSYSGHLLGTDDLGRDLLARVLAGARVALIVAVLATLLGLVLAMILGVSAGFIGGLYDEMLSRVFDVIATFPTILMAVLIVVALGPSLTGVIVAIGIAVTPRYGRQFRVLTKACIQRNYVQAVIAQGYSSPRVVLRHVLPNILLTIGVIAGGNMGRAAVSEASLSFLGAGVQQPNASWGNMIAQGAPFLQVHPGICLYPGIALCVLAISFSFVGDALRDAFDLTE